MINRLMTTTGMALAIVLLFAVNILASRTLDSARVDLTENRLFTLSEGTKNILANLEDPITLRLYLSQGELANASRISGYTDRVRSLLREYERLADGQIDLQVIDPEPFTDDEDRAVGYGLQGVPVGNEGANFYFGLVGTNSVDQMEVIPFLAAERETFLEYDLTRLVYGLTRPPQKIVGLLSTLPIEGPPPGIPQPPGQNQREWVVLEQLRQLFEVRTLDQSLEEIDGDIDILMLVHPQELPPKALYAIDQYVLRGGRILAFLDPFSEIQMQVAAQGGVPPGGSRRSELGDLLATWGVSLGDDVAADLSLSMQAQFQRGGRVFTFDYPVWMVVKSELFDGDDIVTGNLGNISMATAGFFEVAKGATTTMTPLISTTDGVAKVTPQRIDEVNSNPQSLRDDLESEGSPLPLVVRVAGPVVTAFPDGPPKEESEGEEGSSVDESASTGDHLSESIEDAQMILVADSDVLTDRLWVSVQQLLGNRIAIPNSANGSFVVNAVDNLTGSGDLISVRNRGSFSRPFSKVIELRQQAERDYRAKEQELSAKLQDAERRLRELEERYQENSESLILGDAQREEIRRFRQERVRINKELRDVRRQLRADIESLQGWLRFVNIGLVPILIGIGGLLAGFIHLRRRRRATSSLQAA
ncbi:GldG family protein [Thioalkalivibrio sp. HK1]|uniref:GldG family protein n=1 Tax=Thioalkalivibrio sp. HK1 TaxID=1469245 RepID=UPI0004719344|nr:Gldg family protein [Thioalkalivibrio sp. HK1]